MVRIRTHIYCGVYIRCHSLYVMHTRGSQFEWKLWGSFNSCASLKLLSPRKCMIWLQTRSTRDPHTPYLPHTTLHTTHTILRYTAKLVGAGQVVGRFWLAVSRLPVRFFLPEAHHSYCKYEQPSEIQPRDHSSNEGATGTGVADP